MNTQTHEPGKQRSQGKPAIEQDEGPRSFSVFVSKLADGEAEQHLSHELHELAKRLQEQAVAQNDKVKGTLTLTINFIAEPKGFVGIGYDIASKEPKPRRQASMFWLTKGGNLTPHNPAQLGLELREVPAGVGRGYREVGGAPPADDGNDE